MSRERSDPVLRRLVLVTLVLPALVSTVGLVVQLAALSQAPQRARIGTERACRVDAHGVPAHPCGGSDHRSGHDHGAQSGPHVGGRRSTRYRGAPHSHRADAARTAGGDRGLPRACRCDGSSRRKSDTQQPGTTPLHGTQPETAIAEGCRDSFMAGAKQTVVRANGPAVACEITPRRLGGGDDPPPAWARPSRSVLGVPQRTGSA